MKASLVNQVAKFFKFVGPETITEQKLLQECKEVAASSWNSHARAFSSLHPVASAHEATIKQLKFLLASAPMMEMPSAALEARAAVGASIAPFAYIHPKTMAKITFEPVKGSFMIFPGSPTKWVLTSLMPERRVIFSPLAIPGLEKILAE
jgi:hypothetical protein